MATIKLKLDLTGDAPTEAFFDVAGRSAHTGAMAFPKNQTRRAFATLVLPTALHSPANARIELVITSPQPTGGYAWSVATRVVDPNALYYPPNLVPDAIQIASVPQAENTARRLVFAGGDLTNVAPGHLLRVEIVRGEMHGQQADAELVAAYLSIDVDVGLLLAEADALYATLAHTHAALYAALGHNHDASYSALAHAHAGDYSAVGHNHSALYSVLAHAHAGDYSALGHDHAALYAALAGVGGFVTWANIVHRITGQNRFRYLNSMAQVGLSAPVTASNSAALSISWTGAFFDTDAMWSGATPTRLIAKIAGKHLIGGAARIAANATGVRYFGYAVNGGGSNWLGGGAAGATNFSLPNGLKMLNFGAGDYVEFQVFQDSGGNLDVSASDTHAFMAYAGE